MLRIVHPRPPGQGTRPPKRRRTCGSLAPDEIRHLRAALHNLRRAYGSWSCLAEVMGMSEGGLKQAANGACNPSPGVALYAARAGGMSVEAVIGGKLSAAGRCKACGARLGANALPRAGGAAC